MTIAMLSEFTAADVDRVGGKGANLGELIKHGFPIPPGFVVCADEYARVVADLEKGVPPEEMRTVIEAWSPDERFLQDVTSCHDRLQAERKEELVYAVRSSATAEDLGDASFAGQHETFYYVTYADLITMIRMCWASLWGKEAVAYRDTQGIDHHDVHMAVVVQEMIPSEISGITFTANPLTGALNEIVSDATWGMGAAIVDGRVTPDHYVVERESRDITTHRIANKTQMVSTTRVEDGERMLEVPHHLQQISCLSEEQIHEVSEWGLKSEAHFGNPQDLEWAFHDDTYFMLQSRPITTLSDDEEPEPSAKLVLFKAIAENFTDPLSPLTMDVLSKTNPLHFYKGRGYMGLDEIKALLPLKMTDEQAAELVSWELPDKFKIRVNWLMLPVSLLVWLIIYILLGISQARSRRQPDDFMELFRAHVEEVVADDKLSPAGAMAKLFAVGKPFHQIGLQVMPINVTSVIRYFALMGLLNKLLEIWIPDIQRDAGSLLCSGSYGVKSTEMGRNVFRLSVVARKEQKVVSILRSNKPDTIHEALKTEPAAVEFLAALDEFLAVHGHRALKEFELSVPRFVENPTPVLAMIKNYMVSDSNPDEMEQHTTDARVALAESVQLALKDMPLEPALGWRWKIVEYLSDRARHFIKLRENSRFYHIMGWDAARRKILKVEKELVSRGKLKVKGDIFYLLWTEVRALQDDALEWLDVEEIIRNRRMRTLRWSKQGAKKMINIQSNKVAKVLAKGELGGQGASPGQYEGIARVIMDPSVDAEIHPGEILVAPYTDPAWTPLFLIARAAVVGVGSYLSHAGTIAREYGMPCVVDVNDCTSRIKSGDRILVDGTEGTVHLIAEDEEDT